MAAEDQSCQEKHLMNIISTSLSIYMKLMKIISTYWLIGLVGSMFTNGLGDLGSIPGLIIPKTLKMVLNTS